MCTSSSQAQKFSLVFIFKEFEDFLLKNNNVEGGTVGKQRQPMYLYKPRDRYSARSLKTHATLKLVKPS